MARVYATRADLVAYAATYGTRYTIPPDPEATGLLTLASQQVERMATEPYDVDSVTLLPTDADVTAALRDATCASVLRHLDHATGGAYKSVAIGSVRLDGAESADFSGAPLAPDPLAHLRAAGLANTWAATYR